MGNRADLKTYADAHFTTNGAGEIEGVELRSYANSIADLALIISEAGDLGVSLAWAAGKLGVAASGITATELASDAVTTAKILNANVTTAKLADAGVTYAKFQNVTALSIVGRASNSDGVAAAITAASDGDVLRRSGASIGFGAIPIASVTSLQTTLDAKELLANKDTDAALAANSDTKYPSQKAVKGYVDAAFAANDAMIFKGVIDASANPNYPAAEKGHTYRISVAGKIGGASGPNVEVGDLIIAIADGLSAGNHATVGSSWTITQSNLDGAVIGPSSVTDLNPAIFDGTSGKLIKQVTYATFKTSLSLAPADFGNRTAISVLGRAGITDGPLADISTTTLGHVLNVPDGGGISWGKLNAVNMAANSIVTAAITDANVTLAKIVSATATSRILGRITAGSGVWEELTGANVATIIGYTAADVLTKLLTVDGATSGLDADFLDGQSSAFYQSASNLNAGTLPDARISGAYTGFTTITLSSNLTLSTAPGVLTNTANAVTFRLTTSDGSDTGAASIGGGGALATNRGGMVRAFGNEHSSAGNVELTPGDPGMVLILGPWNGGNNQTQDATYTFALTDAGGGVLHTSAGAHTWTIPTNAAVPFPIGTIIYVGNTGSGATTLARAAGVSLVGGGAGDGNGSLAQNRFGAIRKYANNAWANLSF